MLSKQERSRIAKQNRSKGYRVEYDCVWYHRNQNIFAFRIPTKQQRGDLATFDVVVCKNPVEIHQCKYTYRLMKEPEITNHRLACKKYGVIPVLCWRELYHGLKFEKLN